MFRDLHKRIPATDEVFPAGFADDFPDVPFSFPLLEKLVHAFVAENEIPLFIGQADQVGDRLQDQVQFFLQFLDFIQLLADLFDAGDILEDGDGADDLIV